MSLIDAARLASPGGAFKLEQTKFVNAYRGHAPCLPHLPHAAAAACPIKCKFFVVEIVAASGHCNCQTNLKDAKLDGGQKSGGGRAVQTLPEPSGCTLSSTG